MLQRLGKKRPAADECVEEMDALAVEPVPPGSGQTEYGKGKYAYLKMSCIDGSTRLLRFETREAVERAMALGVAADRLREGDPEELAS
jgi:hypothetical protein